MRTKLTDSMVRGLPAPPSGNRVTYDSDVPGFGCRVTSTGARAFVLNYRVAGRERRITIGSYPAWKTGQAREQAGALRRQVDLGEDPMQTRQEQREAPTIADLANRYREVHLPNKRAGSAENDELALRKHILPRFERTLVTDVRHADIVDLHREITKTTPIAANRIVALLSTMFSLAIREEWRADNPCKGIKKNQENRRERFLSPAEIARLSEALAASPEQASANAVRLLLLTGARRGEMLGAKWSEFDLAAGTWVKPGSRTKQRTLHRVPLSVPAISLLSQMKAAAGNDATYVFPSTSRPGPDGLRTEQPMQTLKTMWSGVRRKAGLDDVHLHDLRHSFASLLASGGASLPLIGALLGHSNPITTNRYAHLADNPLRAATERVGAIVAGATEAGAEVVRMAKVQPK